MEEFFEILQTQSQLPDGHLSLPNTPPCMVRNIAAQTSNSTSRNGNSSQRLGSNTVSSTGTSPHHSHSQQQQQPDDPTASYHEIPYDAACISGFGLEVELKDVHFGYHPDRQVLRGVTLRIPPGQSVAIVGSSGSGKSTILKLVTRLYDVTTGSVEVNGVDIKDLTRDSLRAAVAVVPQDTVLFNDTILQNIR